MKVRILLLFAIGTFAWYGSAAQISIKSGSNTENPIKITDLSIKVKVVGNIATTSFEMTVTNTSKRTLEGELSLPLNGDQDICRYALDVNGKLREGVPVEKIKARQTFEAIVRRGVDPGLVQKTKGNIFKTKIYPITPNGKRTVAIGITETLTAKNGKLLYSLPLEGIDTVGHFTVDVAVVKGSTSQTPSTDGGFSTISFDNQENTYNLSFKRDSYRPEKAISFAVPQFNTSKEQLYTTEFEGKTFFYLYAQAPLLAQQTKPTPSTIAVYWDNSSSADRRAIDKELQLLEVYLNRLKGAKQVVVYTFNHEVAVPKTFTVADNAAPLIAYLKSVKNDGATRLDNISFSSKASEILLFTDGINTISTDEVKLPSVPVYTFISAAGCNTSMLRYIANKTNGEAINLQNQQVEAAVIPMLGNNERFVGVTYDKTKMQDVYPTTSQSINGSICLSGILLSDKATLTVNYGNKQGVTQSQAFSISKDAPQDASVVRVWAKMKIAELDTRYEQNKEEIAELGQKFGIVTRNTSFLVLESINDYVQYGIEPPAELRAEYNQIMANRPKPSSDGSENIVTQNAQYVKMLSDWYNAKPAVKPIKKKHRTGKRGGRVRFSPPVIRSDEEVTEGEEMNSQDTLNAAPLDENVGQEIVATPVEAVREIAQEEEPAFQAVEQVAARKSEEPIEVVVAGYSNTSKKEKPQSIALQPWMPDAPYLRVLRETVTDKLDSTYFALKANNADRPAFFIEVSDFFFKKEMKATGIRVLLSLLEMDAENPELLKIAAHRLVQEGDYADAILIYQEVKKLRPEEPQSYRDLAVAYELSGQYQNALDLYCYIMGKSWGRFDIIKEVILNEMNALIAAHRKKLDISNVEPSYIMPMSENVRIVMDWSTNDNDIDLWVDDPSKERCMYSHKRTEAGGKISADFTGGYGPEEFIIKKAIPGEYKVFTNYFSDGRQSLTGPVTIYLTLYTNYGTPKQVRKSIAVQLKDHKESISIGSITFTPGK
ncbi:VIT domain-containing protein [uncultured Acetobacteroides sp.]|uniref:VIT domain-containing protein n=1 Tax=uncultured Acetobacteroides sp. TaxID=1760811 RepID=UPI0029F49BB6|nr:VIT domain-containing protein [uncultured Acetobacteroides sp.]